jgi:amidase
MGRSVDDCFAVYHALTGPHPHDPTSAIVDRPAVTAPRVAVSPDLDVTTVSRAVRDRFAEAVAALADALGPATEASPDCDGAIDAFKTIRAAHVHQAFAPLEQRFGDRLTPTVAWNIAAGRGLTADAYLAAEARRTTLRRRFADFFAVHDLLVLPAASVLPWPNDDGEVEAIDGHRLGDVLDYLAITFVVSLTGHPVLAIPAPQGAHLLPYGLQIVARPGEEATLLAVGRRLEAAGFRHRFPSLAAQ